MVESSQLSPGMIVTIGKKLCRVESVVKVAVAKRAPYIRTKLREMETGKMIEESFKPTEKLKEVELKERPLEFMYKEGKEYWFFDIDSYEKISVSSQIVGDRANYLQVGTMVKGYVYEETVYSLELPQFVEIMVSSTEKINEEVKKAVLETKATVEVPKFIEVGDVIRVDTTTNQYSQRV